MIYVDVGCLFVALLLGELGVLVVVSLVGLLHSSSLIACLVFIIVRTDRRLGNVSIRLPKR